MLHLFSEIGIFLISISSPHYCKRCWSHGVSVCADGGEVCIIERLFSSSLVALVELSNPRKLRVCHFKKNSEICTYSYPDTILTVKLNRQVRTLPSRDVTGPGCTVASSPFSCLEIDRCASPESLHSQHQGHEGMMMISTC